MQQMALRDDKIRQKLKCLVQKYEETNLGENERNSSGMNFLKGEPLDKCDQRFIEFLSQIVTNVITT